MAQPLAISSRVIGIGMIWIITNLIFYCACGNIWFVVVCCIYEIVFFALFYGFAKYLESAFDLKIVCKVDLPKIQREAAVCPITKNPIVNPVVASDGYIYEREAFVRTAGNMRKFVVSPVTGRRIDPHFIGLNDSVRDLTFLKPKLASKKL